MTDVRRPEEEVVPDEDSRRQLWFRAGMAGGMIALLLGGLAVFDHLSRPKPAEELALPTKPIAPAQVTPDAGRDAPPEVIRAGADAAADASAETPAAEGGVPPLPSEPSTAEAPVDRLEDVPRQATGRAHHGSDAARRPLSNAEASRAMAPTPATARPTVAGSAPSVGALPPREAGTAGVPVQARPAAAVTPHATSAPAVVSAPVVAAPPVPAQQLNGRNAPAAVGAASPAGVAAVAEVAGRGYVLQFGFFTSAARAEELKARLAQAGVPAQVETRLVVGPFADRKEALAAQARLREKGIADTGVLLPLGR